MLPPYTHFRKVSGGAYGVAFEPESGLPTKTMQTLQSRQSLQVTGWLPWPFRSICSSEKSTIKYAYAFSRIVCIIVSFRPLLRSARKRWGGYPGLAEVFEKA